MNNEKREWQTLSSKTTYKNKWIRVIEDKVILPSNKDGIYSYVEKSDGNYIIPMDDKDNIYLIEEYKYPIKKFVLQLVAGALDGLNELESAKKELYEEAGIKAKKWRKLGGFYHIPGLATIYDPIYLATELNVADLKSHSDEDDELISRVIKVSITKLKQMILNNEIECAMSVAGLNLLFLWLDSKAK